MERIAIEMKSNEYASWNKLSLMIRYLRRI